MKSKPKKNVGSFLHLIKAMPAASSSCAVLALAFLGLSRLSIAGAAVDYVPVALEQAPGPDGPWTASPVRPPHLTGDGRLLLPAVHDHEFWRLKITRASDIGFELGLPLIDVPPGPIKTARGFLDAHSDDRAVSDPVGDPFVGDPFAGWRRVRIADTVIPVYEAAFDGGRTPAYLEFKIISDEPSSGPGLFRSTDGALKPDRGFILVSLTENDFPVADWFTEGETRIEQLRRRAGTSEVKPLMFGSSLLVAEDPAGNVRATEGTVFSRPGAELLTRPDYAGSVFEDSSTGESNRTPGLEIESPLQPYGSYAEMKADYETNAFFRTVRDGLRNEARIQWLIENGAFPAEFRVQAGETVTILAGRNVREARLELPDDDAVIARLMPLGGDGLQIDGLAQGSGVLHVQVDGQDEIYTLLVTPKEPGFVAAGGFTPGWRLVKLYQAGSDSDQRRYHQNQSLEYGGGGEGNHVGCGPCAWTMLMGWWDLKGVPAAYRPFKFGSGIPNFLLGSADAPSGNTFGVEDMMRDFRNIWVDPALCNPFSGQCATLPSEMSEGLNYYVSLSSLYNLAYLPLFQEPVLGYSYTHKWTYVPKKGVSVYNKLARESLHDGWPSIMGVGLLSHYAVAYEYIESRYELAPGYFPYWRAWLKFNWGNGGSKYLKFTDPTFFATKVKLWQKHTAYVGP
jgi:hypothetical protein